MAFPRADVLCVFLLAIRIFSSPSNVHGCVQHTNFIYGTWSDEWLPALCHICFAQLQNVCACLLLIQFVSISESLHYPSCCNLSLWALYGYM